MYLRNGQEFDIYVLHLIGEVQYPAGYFVLQAQRDAFEIIEIAEPVKPSVTSTQKVVQDGFEQVNGSWQAKWIVSDQNEQELAATAAQLVTAKIARNSLINEWREQANFTTFPYGGKLIACDTLSRSDIDAVAGHIALFGTLPSGFPGGWKATDNATIFPMGLTEFKDMYSAMTTQGTANFMRSQTLKASLASATNLSQVNAIVW